MVVGDGFSRLYTDELGMIHISLPDIETQQSILFKIKEFDIKNRALIELKERKIAKLQEYKKSLIYEYVTGKKEI